MNIIRSYEKFKRFRRLFLLFCFLALSPLRAPLVKAETQRSAPLVDCPPSISFGETIECSILAATEVDEYTFTADASDTILVRMSKSSGDLSPRIKMFSGATELCQAQDSDMAEIASCVLPDNGTYTILADDKVTLLVAILFSSSYNRGMPALVFGLPDHATVRAHEVMDRAILLHDGLCWTYPTSICHVPFL